MSVRIVVADDHEIARFGYAGLLATQADFTVVGTARDGAEAVRVCGEESPDVALMDVRMPVMDGIEATARLQNCPVVPRVLVLTTFDLDEHVYDALAAGASGFLLKDVTAERLFEAVRVVAAGEALLAPGITRRLIAEFARLRPKAPTQGSWTSSPRARPTCCGCSRRAVQPELAARLHVGEETVKTHVSRILSKLGLRDRTQAVVMAYETGLVVPRTG